ncbi:MAG: polysaccharide biosynthesis C-terminal domain-containing protein, partial [Oscillospiraceae bacterium]
QGHATTAMLSVLIGAIINIVLDPVFIFVFDMGVKGAALATIMSQAVSAIWVLAFLFGKKSGLKIRIENIRLNKKIIG